MAMSNVDVFRESSGFKLKEGRLRLDIKKKFLS